MSNVKAMIITACTNRAAQQREGKDGKTILTADKYDELTRNLAFFQTETFAAIAEKHKINVGFIDGSNGAQWLDAYALTRLRRFVLMIEAGISKTEKETDQLRYAVSLMQTLRNAVAIDKKARITKADALATATKGQNRETANGYAEGYIGQYVSVATRIMAIGTAKRQNVMTLRAFESLGMVEKIDERAAGGAVTFSAKPAASYYKRADKVFLDGANA